MSIHHGVLYRTGNGHMHACPHNGQIHVGHPRECLHASCRGWGQALDHADALLEEETEAARHPVYAWIGVGLTILMFALAAGAVVIVLRNL